jgi:cytosolic prostaglandin-E synthase
MNNNPSILWAQDRDKLFVTIEIKNFKNKDIVFDPKIVIINGEANNTEFDISIDLNSEIDTEKSIWIVKQNCIELKLAKVKNIFWHKLTKNKQNNVRIDWQRWKDEDEDEDEDENDDNMLSDFSDFQKQLPEEFMNKNFEDLMPQDLDLDLDNDNNLEVEELEEIASEDIEGDDESDGEVILENNDIYNNKTNIEELETTELNDEDVDIILE